MAVKKKSVKAPGVSRVRAQKSAALTLPQLGAPWKGQGGIFIGIVQGDNGEPNAFLVLATAPSSILKGIYGPREIIKGTESEHDGRGNTRALAAAGSKIAKQALALKIDGHADFYIPARHEARLCYLNAGALGHDGWHWTSTQYRAYGDFAWAQTFGSGNQYYSLKDDELSVRVVRRVPFNNLTIR